MTRPSPPSPTALSALGARIILIAGPSSSGKTTFAQRLRVHLKVLGRHPQQLSLDNYYLDRDTLPRGARRLP